MSSLKKEIYILKYLVNSWLMNVYLIKGDRSDAWNPFEDNTKQKYLIFTKNPKNFLNNEKAPIGMYRCFSATNNNLFCDNRYHKRCYINATGTEGLLTY